MRTMNFMTIFYSNRLLSGSSSTANIFIKITSLASILAVMMVLFQGCEEDPSKIGGGILPDNDFTTLNATDTIGVNLYTMYTDTIRSTQPTISYIGQLQDPVFGTTTTSFVSQLWLFNDWPGDGILGIDSVMFYLNITGVTGEAGDVGGAVNIYEIDRVMGEDSVYYTNTTPPVKELISTVLLRPIEKDTLLRINMGMSPGDVFLRDTSMLFLSSDSADFRTLIKGVWIEYLPASENHMFEVDVSSGQTGFEVHYTDAAANHSTYPFGINSKTVKYNRYIHDFSTADPGMEISHINDMVKDSLSYIQSFQGVFTRIEIPGLEALREMMPLGINKASLVLPAFTDDMFFPEENIIGLQVLARFNNSDGLKEIVPDYLLSNEFFDGRYYGIDREFRINLVNFIQKYLEGEIPEPVVELFLPVSAKRNLVLWSENEDKPVRLELVFTTL
ncbi:MAG: DUF4270 domain-containing protein [Bacteroidales bacterium]|nr:DUF4270 domain-containing protein [Bacteroidales bacterium]